MALDSLLWALESLFHGYFVSSQMVWQPAIIDEDCPSWSNSAFSSAMLWSEIPDGLSISCKTKLFSEGLKVFALWETSIRFMTQDMVYLGECSTCVLVLLGYMFYMYVPVRFYWLIILFRSFIFLLTFCPVVPSVADKGVLSPFTFNIISTVATSTLLCSFVQWIYINECWAGILNTQQRSLMGWISEA